MHLSQFRLFALDGRFCLAFAFLGCFFRGTLLEFETDLSFAVFDKISRELTFGSIRDKIGKKVCRSGLQKLLHLSSGYGLLKDNL